MWSLESLNVSRIYCAFTPSAFIVLPPAGYFWKKASTQPSPNAFAASLPEGSMSPYRSSLTFTFSPSSTPMREESFPRPARAAFDTSIFAEVSRYSRLSIQVIIFVIDAG